MFGSVGSEAVKPVSPPPTRCQSPGTMPTLRQTVARSGAGADVLHGAGDVIGQAVIDADVIELAPRQRRREPGFAAVGRDVHAAVVAVEDAARILRIDPDVMMIAVVRPLDALEGLAAVDALEQRHLRAPDDVGVARIDGEGGVVKGALADGALIVDELPGIAAVVAAEQSALVRLDEGVDAPAIGRRDGDADLAPDAFGQPLGVFLAFRRVLAEIGRIVGRRRDELRPVLAAVARDVQAAARSAADQLPRPPPRLPQAGEQDLRIGRIESRRRTRRCRRP